MADTVVAKQSSDIKPFGWNDALHAFVFCGVAAFGIYLIRPGFLHLHLDFWGLSQLWLDTISGAIYGVIISFFFDDIVTEYESFDEDGCSIGIRAFKDLRPVGYWMGFFWVVTAVLSVLLSPVIGLGLAILAVLFFIGCWLSDVIPILRKCDFSRHY
jgi:hypothetical protein